MPNLIKPESIFTPTLKQTVADLWEAFGISIYVPFYYSTHAVLYSVAGLAFSFIPSAVVMTCVMGVGFGLSIIGLQIPILMVAGIAGLAVIAASTLLASVYSLIPATEVTLDLLYGEDFTLSAFINQLCSESSEPIKISSLVDEFSTPRDDPKEPGIAEWNRFGSELGDLFQSLFFTPKTPFKSTESDIIPMRTLRAMS